MAEIGTDVAIRHTWLGYHFRRRRYGN